MSTITALAHATQPAAPPFNGLFYATAATIIPVLFLALAVQGRGYQNLLKAFATMGRYADSTTGWAWGATLTASCVLAMTAMFILGIGIISEIAAILALYDRQAGNTGREHVVLAGLITLIIATTAGPTLTLLRYYFRYFTNRGTAEAGSHTGPIND